MVDVNNELVGIVGALTEKNEKDRFYVLGLCRRREVGARSFKLGRGGGKAMDGGRKKERENRRYENGLRRERERSGKKEYKGWKRVEKGAKEGERQ